MRINTSTDQTGDRESLRFTDTTSITATAQDSGGGNEAAVSLDVHAVVDGDGNPVVAAAGTQEVGFYGATPDVQPVVPLTNPAVQDVIDALVAVGLIAQHD